MALQLTPVVVAPRGLDAGVAVPAGIDGITPNDFARLCQESGRLTRDDTGRPCVDCAALRELNVLRDAKRALVNASCGDGWPRPATTSTAACRAGSGGRGRGRRLRDTRRWRSRRQSCTVTFPNVGTYAYDCLFHSGIPGNADMDGVVKVIPRPHAVNHISTVWAATGTSGAAATNRGRRRRADRRRAGDRDARPDSTRPQHGASGRERARQRGCAGKSCRARRDHARHGHAPDHGDPAGAGARLCRHHPAAHVRILPDRGGRDRTGRPVHRCAHAGDSPAGYMIIADLCHRRGGGRGEREVRPERLRLLHEESHRGALAQRGGGRQALPIGHGQGARGPGVRRAVSAMITRSARADQETRS